eukprot:GHVP01053232.1.p1 GENE.GHVP01053232.1~~GHVP01053232.1.p1  ORF type:complete len:691 (+),score=129.60 GHVP01053232.1:22-2094(+)
MSADEKKNYEEKTETSWDSNTLRATKRFAVQNKAAADVQITAEQLLREAVERQGSEGPMRRQRIVDQDDLEDYRVRKRKDFEDSIRRQRQHIGTWIKYATWEAAQKEFRRARSVFERALQVEYQNVSLWQKYIEMEVKNKFIQSARNLYDRVTYLLPRVDQFWFKYAHMEELLGNFAGARMIFDKWMEWEPSDEAWMMYIHFEERCGEIERARLVFERYLSCHTTQLAFLKLARFEEKLRNPDRVRAVFTKALELLPAEAVDEELFRKWSLFEEKQKEHSRARAILQKGIQALGSGGISLEEVLVNFERRHGDRDEVTAAVLTKRRKLYEAELQDNPMSYDAWFDLLRLEESIPFNTEKIEESYEKAISHIPLVNEKRFWRRYIFLWLFYAVWSEKTLEKSLEGRMATRKIYQRVADLIPWKLFSFGKLFIAWAEFEIRCLELGNARKVFGRAIAECGKKKIFIRYAAFELQLGNVDRCRTIFAKFVEKYPTDAKTWIAFFELEMSVEEFARARGLAEIGLSLEMMEHPELIWKKYINTETKLGNIGNARSLYERLVERSSVPATWKAYAQFELKHGGRPQQAKQIIERGISAARDNDRPADRAHLISYLIKLVKKTPELRDNEDIEKLEKRLPKKVTKKTAVHDSTGEAISWQEISAYEFPEDGGSASTLKILEAAKKWKKQKEKESET